MPVLACRRSTDVTSTRSRSGPKTVSPRRRPLKRCPSLPSSASTGARTDASTTSTFVVQGGNGVFRGKLTLAAMLESIQHLVHRRRYCDQGELSGKELLERLPCLLSPAEQSLMDFVRDVSHLHVRHACIIHALDGSDASFSLILAASLTELRRARRRPALGSAARSALTYQAGIGRTTERIAPSLLGSDSGIEWLTVVQNGFFGAGFEPCRLGEIEINRRIPANYMDRHTNSLGTPNPA